MYGAYPDRHCEHITLLNVVNEKSLITRRNVSSQSPEEKMVCPYNNSHHIRKCKIAFHLVKCKQNYHGEQKMITCDFNASHVIPEPELQYHHQICSDRSKFEAINLKTETKYPIRKIDVATEENWDDDCYPTYDAKKYAEENDMLRELNVASASKRKNFRMAERQRLSELSCQIKSNNAVSNQLPNVVPVQMPPRPREEAVSFRQTMDKRSFHDWSGIPANRQNRKITMGFKNEH